ncbi:polysaccharide deacetylase [Nakamurella silvestris]|nr:polysaccharide deacetylase [Nakamurella silvestris]
MARPTVASEVDPTGSTAGVSKFRAPSRGWTAGGARLAKWGSRVRQGKLLIAVLVIALVAVTGVIVYRNLNTSVDAAGDVVVTQTVTRPSTPGSTAGSTPAVTDSSGPSSSGPSSTDPETSGPATSGKPPKTTTADPTTAEVPDDGRPPTNIPMKKLKKGEKAPQFIIFSFDGAGNHDKWKVFRDAAKDSNARFTGFLTGLYLLGDPGKDAYTGPGHAQGKASIGFGGTEQSILDEVQDLNEAYAQGNEIGTHYNGHFCSDNPPGGAVFTTADWNDELDQFFHFMKDWKSLNGYQTDLELKVPTESIKGGRTPCLEGQLDQLIPAWEKHNFTYDSSINAPTPGIYWPEKLDGGIWEFYMPYIYSPGFDDMIVAMDYNMWIQYNAGKEDPSSAPDLRKKVKETYEYMYDEAYNGNRAPILIANHFNTWNGDSFNVPAEEFMREKCVAKDTYCATYSDVIKWMELQDPAVLADLLGQDPVATG